MTTGTCKDWIDIFQKKVTKLNKNDAWQIEFDDSIKPDEMAPGWHEYITKTFAWFQCSRCVRKWPSSRVMIMFHMKLRTPQRRGIVKVRLYKQNCKICAKAPMVKPDVSSDNLEILLGRLMTKIRLKCYHERNDNDNDRPFRMDPVQSPHEPSHCEGCISGICSKNAPGQANHF